MQSIRKHIVRWISYFFSILLGFLSHYGATEVIEAWNTRYDGWLDILALVLACYVVYATWGRHRKNFEALHIVSKR